MKIDLLAGTLGWTLQLWSYSYTWNESAETFQISSVGLHSTIKIQVRPQKAYINLWRSFEVENVCNEPMMTVVLAKTRLRWIVVWRKFWSLSCLRICVVFQILLYYVYCMMRIWNSNIFKNIFSYDSLFSIIKGICRPRNILYNYTYNNSNGCF